MAARRVTRRGALSAAIVSAAILAALVIERTLTLLVKSGLVAAFGSSYSFSFGSMMAEVFRSAFLYGVPVAFGVFVSLWLLAPIGSVLHVAHVLMRSTLAAGVGAVFAIVVSSVETSARLASAYPNVSAAEVLNRLPVNIAYAVSSSIETFLIALPLAALATLLLWVRLREVDREYPVAGMLDL